VKPILLGIIAVCIVGGCVTKQAPTQVPTASSVIWLGADVFVLSQEAGFQWERLELKDGRFRYWFFSDVIVRNSPKYPIEGNCEFKGDQLVLEGVTTYSVRSLQGTKTLWSPAAVDYWDRHRIIDVYGILVPVDRNGSNRVTLGPLFAKEQWDHSREQVKQLERKK
jgi:hypothetical protein